jgi:outer membrane receptor protein involved in Fe transport
LQAQQGTEYELGVRGENPRYGQAHVTWFLSNVDDEILFNPLSFQSENFDTSRMGIECSVQPTLPSPKLTPRLTYTFIESEFRHGTFADRTLPGVPEHQLNAHLGYSPLPALLLWLDWMLVHDFFRINDINNALPGDNYGTLNLGARYTPHPNVIFYLHVANVASEEYTSFQSSNGIGVSTGENPAPPISFRSGVTVKF